MLITVSVQCQSGGDHTFEFLNMTHSARATALGGAGVSILDKEVSLAYLNPGLLHKQMDKELSIHQNFHFAGINHGFINFGRYLEKLDVTSHVGINYFDYGNFIRADEFGQRQGEFDASSLALTFGIGKAINEKFNVGTNLKFISSRLASYSSAGLAVDLGASYNDHERRMTFGFVIKNIGLQIKTYNGAQESLPLDIQLGVSKRFAHLPFRFSLTAQRLYDWNLSYTDPTAPTTTILGDPVQQPSEFSKFTDTFFKHLIFSGEFLLGQAENFKLRFGYNHLRRKELSVSTFRSLGGFSLGFGLKIKKFRFDYGVGYYHLAGGVNHISLSTNLNEFKRKL